MKFGIPYLVLTALAFFPKAFISSLGNTSDTVELSLSYFLKTTFLEPRVGVWGHFWFITAFLPIDLLWGLWRSYAPKNKLGHRIGLIVGLIVSLTLAIFPVASNIMTMYDISEVAIFYLFGVLFALAKPILWDKNYKLILGIIVSSVCAYFLYPYGNYMNHHAKRFNLINIINGKTEGLDIIDTCLPNLIVSLLLVWICWCLAQLIGKIKWFTLPQKVAPYVFILFVYGWPAQALVEAILHDTQIHYLIVTAIMFIVGCTVPILIVFIYRKSSFLHCKFFDYLIGINTVEISKKESTQS